MNIKINTVVFYYITLLNIRATQDRAKSDISDCEIKSDKRVAGLGIGYEAVNWIHMA
jgi:hypothetical protein